MNFRGVLLGALVLSSTGCEAIVHFDRDRLDAATDAPALLDAPADHVVADMPLTDAGLDAGADAELDTGVMDAGVDAEVDAGAMDAEIDGGAMDSGADDAGTDAEVDGGADAGTGVDGGADAGTDAEVDGGADAGTDAGPMCSSPGDCDDSDMCTTDTCPSGTCIHAAVSCDDSNECTTDSCVPATGCAHASATGSCMTGAGICRVGACCTGCWDGLTCQPGSPAIGCANGGGACMPCSSPPASTCAANVATTYPALGACGGGACTYAPSMMTCTDGCFGGACTAAFASLGSTSAAETVGGAAVPLDVTASNGASTIGGPASHTTSVTVTTMTMPGGTTSVVEIFWSLDPTFATSSTVAMTVSSSTAGADTWTGVIPAQAIGVEVYFYLRATPYSGAQAYDPSGFGIHYAYAVN